MRIFSNFDTKFKSKLIEKKQETYKKEDLIVITRSRYYFFFKVFIPFAILLALGVMILMFLQNYSINWYISIPLGIVWFLVVWFRIIHKWFKYCYDFTIIMPRGVVTYKQKGILHSYIKEIPANRIRSIQVSRNTFL